MDNNNQDLQSLLNKLILFLESSIIGLHVIESVVTNEDFLILTFVYRNKNEQAIYVEPSIWPTLSFFDLCKLIIDKIEMAYPTPKSLQTH